MTLPEGWFEYPREAHGQTAWVAYDSALYPFLPDVPALAVLVDIPLFARTPTGNRARRRRRSSRIWSSNSRSASRSSAGRTSAA